MFASILAAVACAVLPHAGKILLITGMGMKLTEKTETEKAEKTGYYARRDRRDRRAR